MNTPPPSLPVCRHLRSKQMYLPHLAAEGTVLRPPHPDDAFFTCNRTLSALGCDDDAVHPHVCGPGRVCYKS